jgi:polyvinyl alcohol dehydrogenase (cytochrome)
MAPRSSQMERNSLLMVLAYLLGVALPLCVPFAVCAQENSEEVRKARLLRELEPPDEGPGREIFHSHCAVCHEHAGSEAPGKAALQVMSASTIYETVTSGRMRAQAAGLSDPERHQVAEYLGYPRPDTSSTHPLKACQPKANWFDRRLGTVGNGWGVDAQNTRLIDAKEAGLTAKDLAHLKLKWVFEFPDASTAVAQPLVAGGALFVGSQNGTVYALDAQVGCVRWTFKGTSEILGTLVLRDEGFGSPTLFFADRLAYVYAIDAFSGKLVWRKTADDHPSATIMGTPSLLVDRLFVPVISLEETAAGPSYPCCTFRGSIVALTASTGSVIWKRYAIPKPAVQQHKNVLGVPQFAPSGAGVWSAPAIDSKRGLLYFATGNAYSEPADDNSDAVFAVDIATGKVRWHTQTFANDSWTIWEFLCQTDSTKRTAAGCPSLKKPGPDIDFTTSPVLVHANGGMSVVVAGRKDGVTFGFDPETGRILWSTRTSASSDPNAASLNFGIMAEGARIFVPSVGTEFPNGGTFVPMPDDGLYALDALTGNRLWSAKVRDDCGKSTPCTGLSFAPIGFPGVVFAGATDGYVRAYDTATGKVLWRFDTARSFVTLNGDVASGGAVGRNSIMIANGVVYVGSGYSRVPGNVLLAFTARP